MIHLNSEFIALLSMFLLQVSNSVYVLQACPRKAVVFNLFCTIAPLQELCLKIAPPSIIFASLRFLKIVFCLENNSVLMKY